MLMNRPQVVFRVRPGVKLDSYGEPVEDWTNAERTRMAAIYVQSGSSAEDPDKLLAGQRKLFVRGAVDLKAEDRIEIDGELWRVEGDARVRHGLAMGTFTAATLSRPVRRANEQQAQA